MTDRPLVPATSSEVPEEMQVLMMGYLDGELNDEQTQTFLTYLETHDVAQRELAQYRRLVDVANSLRLREPADDERDRFWDNVSNRTQHRGGWILVVCGVLALTVALVVAVFRTELLPWPLKAGIGVLAAGFAILFISVVRLRLRTLPYDRYRDVQR